MMILLYNYEVNLFCEINLVILDNFDSIRLILHPCYFDSKLVYILWSQRDRNSICIIIFVRFYSENSFIFQNIENVRYMYHEGLFE
jgi:hypothetical protein